MNTTETKVTINGISMDFHLTSGGLGWCDRWGDVHDLVPLGYIRARYGAYGSVTYYLTDKGRKAAD